MKELLKQDSLLEIGTEEIPAGYLPPALSYIKSFSENALRQQGLAYENISAFGTPRRMALLITGVAAKSAPKIEKILGPSLAASKDSGNEWTQAAKGFAQAHRASVDSLTVEPTKKGDYLCVTKKHGGVNAEKILKDLFIELISSIPFPKKMAWNKTQFKFARPIRNIVGLYGPKIVPVNIAGIKSADKTFGLSHLSATNIRIHPVENYVTILKNHCVLVDPESRKKTIQHSASQLANKVKAQTKLDEGLIDEIVWMVEHPVAILGNFSQEFLSLPQAVLVTCMKKHQRFFPVLDHKDKLLPYFIGIRNGLSEHQETVRKGYEKVLNARLVDAKFFFDEDIKRGLETHIKKSNRITLQVKLGSVGDKIDRMKNIAKVLIPKSFFPAEGTSEGTVGPALDPSIIERAIHLCKFDWATSMVYEYPELQGVVGEIYASHYGENPVVARAIREHYYPLTNQGELPQTNESKMVAFIEKMEGLVGNFLIGLVPSGSADPYGLRRQSTGILRIVMNGRWEISLKECVRSSMEQFPRNINENSSVEKIESEILSFLLERFQLLMQDSGYALDEIYAVTKNGRDPDTQNLKTVRLEQKIAALHAVRKHPDFDAVATAFKRAGNILKQARAKLIDCSQEQFSESLLQQPAEKEFYSAMSRVAGVTQLLIRQKKYTESLQEWVAFRNILDQFFEKVMVMDPDPALSQNRLSLLSILETTFKQIADFSLIQNNNGPAVGPNPLKT